MRKLVLFAVLFFGFSSSVFAERTWKHLFGISYIFNSVATFDDTQSRDGTDSEYYSDVEIDFDNAFGIVYEARLSEANSWGLALGIEYVGARKADEMRIQGLSYSLSGERAEITSTMIYASAIYQWENFYLPFGLNIASVDYKLPKGVSGSVDSNAGAGIHFGAGWNFDDKAFLELVIKSVTYTLNIQSGSTSTDFEEGAMAYGGINFKYNFF